MTEINVDIIIKKWKCITEAEAITQEGNEIVIHNVVQYNKMNHINS